MTEPTPPKRRSWRDRLGALADRNVQVQSTKLRLILVSVPFVVLFGAVGASPMVAICAGMAMGLLGAGPRFLTKGRAPDESGRGYLIAGGGALAVAVGVQVLVWRLGLDDETAMRFVIFGYFALFGLLLLVELVRAAVRWVRGRWLKSV